MPDILISMTEDEERAVIYQRTPGGVESLDEEERQVILSSRDPQLDRAMDMLHGMTLMAERAELREAGKGVSDVARAK